MVNPGHTNVSNVLQVTITGHSKSATEKMLTGYQWALQGSYARECRLLQNIHSFTAHVAPTDVGRSSQEQVAESPAKMTPTPPPSSQVCFFFRVRCSAELSLPIVAVRHHVHRLDQRLPTTCCLAMQVLVHLPSWHRRCVVHRQQECLGQSGPCRAMRWILQCPLGHRTLQQSRSNVRLSRSPCDWPIPRDHPRTNQKRTTLRTAASRRRIRPQVELATPTPWLSMAV